MQDRPPHIEADADGGLAVTLELEARGSEAMSPAAFSEEPLSSRAADAADAPQPAPAAAAASATSSAAPAEEDVEEAAGTATGAAERSIAPNAAADIAGTSPLGAAAADVPASVAAREVREELEGLHASLERRLRRLPAGEPSYEAAAAGFLSPPAPVEESRPTCSSPAAADVQGTIARTAAEVTAVRRDLEDLQANLLLHHPDCAPGPDKPSDVISLPGCLQRELSLDEAKDILRAAMAAPEEKDAEGRDTAAEAHSPRLDGDTASVAESDGLSVAAQSARPTNRRLPGCARSAGRNDGCELQRAVGILTRRLQSGGSTYHGRAVAAA
eukprot:TRINITY_DN6610_c0_g1_i1.p1 TRINITY_DN6610_c0_g1~~TRINITY_DN6610_c0_g1_i1.p1  ORF type:complete len:329 (-),score=72.62 TRINITY_DN6610_c0_g1_i1:139-1125(-)